MERRELRENIMHLIFQLEAQGDFSEENIDYLLLQNEYSVSDRKKIERAALLFCEKKEEIDELIERKGKWSLKRMPKAELAILRLGIAEMLFFDEIPPAVAIDEAVELSKIYGCDDGSSFVNGILGSVYRERTGSGE